MEDVHYEIMKKQKYNNISDVIIVVVVDLIEIGKYIIRKQNKKSKQIFSESPHTEEGLSY